jgi:hypothetical protein
MGIDAKIERIAEIVAYILRLMGGKAFTETKLVKLVYLLDVIQSRKGHPHFSGAVFRSYYPGPSSDDVMDAISLLLKFGYVSMTKKQEMDGIVYHHFKLHEQPLFGRLTDEERLQIREDLLPLVDFNVKRLRAIASKTKESTQVPLGEVINL